MAILNLNLNISRVTCELIPKSHQGSENHRCDSVMSNKALFTSCFIWFGGEVQNQ